MSTPVVLVIDGLPVTQESTTIDVMLDEIDVVLEQVEYVVETS